MQSVKDQFHSLLESLEYFELPVKNHLMHAVRCNTTRVHNMLLSHGEGQIFQYSLINYCSWQHVLLCCLHMYLYSLALNIVCMYEISTYSNQYKVIRSVAAI